MSWPLIKTGLAAPVIDSICVAVTSASGTTVPGLPVTPTEQPGVDVRRRWEASMSVCSTWLGLLVSDSESGRHRPHSIAQ